MLKAIFQKKWVIITFIITFITLLFSIFNTFSVFALTLKEAKKIALENNYELKAVKAALETSNWDVKKSIWSVLPSATASGSYSYYTPSIPSTFLLQNKRNSISASITVTQPIYNGGKGIIGIKTSKESATMSRYNLQMQILNTIYQTEEKYMAVLENKRLLDISIKDLELSKENLSSAEIKFSSGTISKAELLNFQSQVSSKEVSYIQAKNRYELAILDLANFLSLNPNNLGEIEDLDLATIKLYKKIIEKADIKELETIVKKAVDIGLKNNPTILIAESNVKIQNLSLAVAKQAFLPSINLSFTNSWDKDNTDNNYSYQGIITLSGSVPLFPIINNYDNLKKNQEMLNQSKNSYEATKNNIILSIKNSLYNFIAAARSIDSSQKSLSYIEESYRQTKVRFDQNLISSSDLLNAEILLNNARIQYTDSLYNFMRNKSVCMNVLGITDENKFFSIFNIKDE
ncbi:MAG: hypothetical protein DRP84_07745 [Spirochaetes bacterium]|nr:MAG: hypothetical protein DRP84_07745 [Spirochaetota bacterium]